jgi:protein CpxP
MTTRFKTSLAAGVAALTLAGAGTLVLAQDQPQQQQQRRRGPGAPGMDGPMRGPGPMPGRRSLGEGGFHGLDLTDDQQAQLRKIREARQAEFKATGEKLRAARQGMRSLIEAETLNEGAIRAKAAEVAAAEAEVAILNARVRQESLQVLTTEQQQKLKEFREQRGGQMKQRRGPKGQ